MGSSGLPHELEKAHVEQIKTSMLCQNKNKIKKQKNFLEKTRGRFTEFPPNRFWR